ncbi:MerR family transcriptional regulator [Inhella sp.]|uniref:MerR family transcriptional regulator n=1 Tax=Inhella sp. TaxID=1921806 RepID=UPI0035AF4E88
MNQPPSDAPAVAPSAAAPTFRSGAVARMVGMPVATLRIWEQRYQAVHPATAASGHRLYSPADVQRVLMLRQLTEQGHAIGTLAALDAAQLHEVAQQARLGSPGSMAATGRRAASGHPRLRVLVVGSALAARLHRPRVARHLALVGRLLSVVGSLDEAAQAGTQADLLLWHAPELRLPLPTDLAAAREASGARRVGVVYRFAGTPVIGELAEAGMASLREPADDEALGAWLGQLMDQLELATATAAEPAARSASPEHAFAMPAQAAAQVPPRRYDDATLTSFAGLSPTLACECPRHVAELLMQLSSFEAYSAGCLHRDSADAQLHAYLHQVAGASRALFESALERLALHEGLPLR